jgi:hypothetical protein
MMMVPLKSLFGIQSDFLLFHQPSDHFNHLILIHYAGGIHYIGQGHWLPAEQSFDCSNDPVSLLFIPRHIFMHLTAIASAAGRCPGLPEIGQKLLAPASF